MKTVIVVLALAGLAASASVPSDGAAAILRSDFQTYPEGRYVFSYETENGLSRHETGELRDALDEENNPHNVVVVRGSYSYTDSEGKTQIMSYFADETGFHVEGDAIPVSRR